MPCSASARVRVRVTLTLALNLTRNLGEYGGDVLGRACARVARLLRVVDLLGARVRVRVGVRVGVGVGV